jgi:hypothetical protein
MAVLEAAEGSAEGTLGVESASPGTGHNPEEQISKLLFGGREFDGGFARRPG